MNLQRLQFTHLRQLSGPLGSAVLINKTIKNSRNNVSLYSILTRLTINSTRNTRNNHNKQPTRCSSKTPSLSTCHATWHMVVIGNVAWWCGCTRCSTRCRAPNSYVAGTDTWGVVHRREVFPLHINPSQQFEFKVDQRPKGHGIKLWNQDQSCIKKFAIIFS